ncbi:MAG: carbohydrate ABC transporter permease [Actinomycetota bacterium]|nr:carbohydrate ABC transporter permease [Actinomycetota bacterium]
MAQRPTDEVAPPHLAAAEQLALEEEVQVARPAPGAIPGRTRVERTRTVVAYGVLVGLAFLYFVPFLWTVSTSFKTLPESVQGFDLVPDHPTLASYREIFTSEDLPFLKFFRNSFFLAGTITVIEVFLVSLGGYAFARLRFPGREVLFMLVLATLMIPDQLRLVPVYLMLSDFPVTGWNLTGTFRGYILIYLVTAANLFLMRQYFLTIPKDYEEAARLDAAGYFKTYWRVMLPLATPALAAVAILTFQGIWNDFFWALIVLGLVDPEKYTVQLGLANFVREFGANWPALMAGATLAILPVVLVYVFFQRYFIAGITTAGVKG